MGIKARNLSAYAHFENKVSSYWEFSPPHVCTCMWAKLLTCHFSVCFWSWTPKKEFLRENRWKNSIHNLHAVQIGFVRQLHVDCSERGLTEGVIKTKHWAEAWTAHSTFVRTWSMILCSTTLSFFSGWVLAASPSNLAASDFKRSSSSSIRSASKNLTNR